MGGFGPVRPRLGTFLLLLPKLRQIAAPTPDGPVRSRVAFFTVDRAREYSMSNSQSDRSQVAASDPSEVRYFGKKHGLTDDQVLALIKEHGNDRKTLEAAVANIPQVNTPIV
jgi:hypothetical protein